MAFTATPDYLGKDFSTAPPGHRFYLYFRVWGHNHIANEAIWGTEDIQKNNKGKTEKVNNKLYATNELLDLNDGAKKAMKALADRQQNMAGDAVWQLPAKTIAPLTTGLGMEHPLENGFAFLNPYGLPYLPGSSIKGVLRQAARELIEDEDEETDWNDELINLLFGPESQDEKDARRGALIFWDALPELPGDKLMTEVMTPHQGKYFESEESPHDSGSPNPIFFLAIPPGSKLTFYVDCNRRLLPEDINDTIWHSLLKEAFGFAFDWLGFGAKTAVGYGHLEIDHNLLEQQEEEKAAQQAEQEEKKRRDELTKNLPQDAAELIEKQIRGQWPKDNNNQVVLDLDAFLSPDRESISQAAYDLIAEELETRWPGITKDPESVRVTKPAKKNKPAKTKPNFSGKSKDIAIRLLEITITSPS